MQNETQISCKLKALRKTSGLSINQVCEHLKTCGYDIAPKTLYSYESGHRIPNTDIFLELCRYYNCTDILFEFGYTDTPQKYPLSSEVSEVYSKYQALPKDGQAVIRNALGICTQQSSDPYIPDTPEELEAIYPPIGSENEKKNIS